MPLPNKTLRVLPNPWSFIDHMGRPAGTCPCDPAEHITNARRWVGAEIDRDKTRITVRRDEGDPRSDEQDTVWSFSKDQVQLPNTPYYRERVRHGDLFAADKATAAICGISDFVDPGKLLRDAELAAIKDFDAHAGEGAFEAWGKERARIDAAAKPEAEPAIAAKPKKGDAQ